MQQRFRHMGCLVLVLSFIGACTSKVLKTNHATEILQNEEFEKQLNVKEMPTVGGLPLAGTYVLFPGPDPIPSLWPRTSEEKTVKKGAEESQKAGIRGNLKEKSSKKVQTKQKLSSGNDQGKLKVGTQSGAQGVSSAEKGAESLVAPDTAVPTPVSAATPVPISHEPSIEDSEGFEGRRPKVDPYRVGEKVTLDVSYFGVTAGEMTLEVRPFVAVNGRKSYNFAGTALSTSVFAMFYAVNDWFESFVDFQTLIPSSYALHVKESKQLRETRCLFDWNKMLATFWDKKINAEEKVEERKFEWALVPYAQNIFTAVYYLRNFQLKVGKKIVFRVAHEKENFDVTGEVIRKEKLSTPAGELDTVVIKPQIHLNGVFRPVGDIFIWLTDDDRKYVVRIESKIKIGTIVASVKAITPGSPQ